MAGFLNKHVKMIEMLKCRGLVVSDVSDFLRSFSAESHVKTWLNFISRSYIVSFIAASFKSSSRKQLSKKLTSSSSSWGLIC